jgi:hypothetical protein
VAKKNRRQKVFLFIIFFQAICKNSGRSDTLLAAGAKGLRCFLVGFGYKMATIPWHNARTIKLFGCLYSKLPQKGFARIHTPTCTLKAINIKTTDFNFFEIKCKTYINGDG